VEGLAMQGDSMGALFVGGGDLGDETTIERKGEREMIG
jgi:hypothetical protein